MTRRTPFLRRVSKQFSQSVSGCWEWSGHLDKNGYAGKLWNDYGKKESPYRTLYTLFFGNIPEGLQLDHLCRNKCCINPLHLEAVSPRENVLRSDNLAARNAKKTHCIYGHPLIGGNLYLKKTKNGRKERQCRICGRNASRKDYQRRKAIINL